MPFFFLKTIFAVYFLNKYESMTQWNFISLFFLFFWSPHHTCKMMSAGEVEISTSYHDLPRVLAHLKLYMPKGSNKHQGLRARGSSKCPGCGAEMTTFIYLHGGHSHICLSIKTLYIFYDKSLLSKHQYQCSGRPRTQLSVRNVNIINNFSDLNRMTKIIRG